VTDGMRLRTRHTFYFMSNYDSLGLTAQNTVYFMDS
jgi:hypothetical protein